MVKEAFNISRKESSFRIIGRLEIKNANVIQTRFFDGLRVVNTLSNLVEYYLEQEFDELYLDQVMASLFDSEPLNPALPILASKKRIPLTVGGNIQKLEDAVKLFDNGADKVAINSFLFKDLSLIEKIASLFGSQAVVCNLQVVLSDGLLLSKVCGRELQALNPLSFVNDLKNVGCGEIFLGSVSSSGSLAGILPSVLDLAEKLPLSTVVYGGIGTHEHIKAVTERNISGCAVSRFVHEQMPYQLRSNSVS